MSKSTSSFPYRIAAFLLLVSVAPITQASELASPFESPISSGGEESALRLDDRFSGVASSQSVDAANGSMADAGNISLFELPLIGQISNFGVRVARADSGQFDGLTQQSLFVDFKLPWQWSPWEGVYATPRLTLELGQFETDLEDRLFGSFGPALRIDNDRWRIPAFVDLGFSPTVIDGSEYGDRNLGTSFNFTSHVALGMRFGRQRDHSVSIRLQHISNGGTNSTNPGVDMIGIDFVFWARPH